MDRDGMPGLVRQLEDLAAASARRATGFRQAGERIAATTVTEHGRDNLVSVTVTANGLVTDLSLGQRAHGMSPARLAAEVLTCLRRAQGRIPEVVTSILREAVPGDDEAAERVIAGYRKRYPAPAPDLPAVSRPPRELDLTPPADPPPPQATQPPPRPAGQLRPVRPVPVDDEDGWDSPIMQRADQRNT